MTYEVEDSSDALVDCGTDATSPNQPDQYQGGQGQEGAATCLIKVRYRLA